MKNDRVSQVQGMLGNVPEKTGAVLNLPALAG
jgi:hypothetical protein